MSRAGKFVPGGAGRKTSAVPGNRTGVIRAPAEDPGGGPAKPERKPLFTKALLNKQVPKNRQMPITVMSAVMCCVLVSFAWYMFKVVPMQRALADEQSSAAAKAKSDADAMAALQQRQEDEKKAAAAARINLTVDSTPSGATVTLGGQQKQTPASFDLPPGPVTVLVQETGFEDSQQSVLLATDKPSMSLTVQLVPEVGNLALTSPQSDVTYTLSGPHDYQHEGALPEHLDSLPVGDYQLVATLGDWKLAPMAIAIHDRDKGTLEIKFPFGSVHLESTPAGATIRDGHTIIGTTPLNLGQQRPGHYRYSIDLAPNQVQWVDATLTPSGSVNQAVTLAAGKNFIAACGLPMMWIPDGFWAAKYLMPQNEFETVGKYNPSSFRKPNRPVETISWENANSFCKKLTIYEQTAGRLPAGFHYALPSETQWSSFSADADINLAAMSRAGSLTSTQDVGYSEPNKYGLYDTLGNVWEWCSDIYDVTSGAHSMRGGCWLSSPENFPGPDTRTAAAPMYPGDHFTGFRVVLVQD